VIILGIDPGSIKCGYGLLEIDGRKIVAAGADVIKIKPGLPLEERISLIYKEIRRIIEEFKPDTVAVESIFYGKNIQSAFTLGHARGVILLAIAQSRLPLFEYSPREIKKAVTGNGNAAKHQIRYMVEQLLNLKESPKSEDAMDALAVALCHFNKIKFNVK
jgi:crossover junction endodeoxyribonuclease RuvC